jgi:hypothetical protein
VRCCWPLGYAASPAVRLPNSLGSMSKHRRKQSGRVTPKGTQPADHRRHRPSREPSLVDDAGRALRQSSPFDLLALASSLIEALADRPAYRWQRRPKPEMTGPEMFESFVEAGIEQTEALAVAVATLHPDEQLARRLRDRITARGSVIRHRPSWLDTIDDIEITDVAEMVHILGDGDNIMIGWRWPDGNTATATIYIDHNMGTIVKDAFVVPESFDTLTAAYRRVGLQDQEIRPIEPAVARAKVIEAIQHGEITIPPLETDSWPVCRPMVEWVLRVLPAGGECCESDRALGSAIALTTGRPGRAVSRIARSAARSRSQQVRTSCSMPFLNGVAGRDGGLRASGRRSGCRAPVRRVLRGGTRRAAAPATTHGWPRPPAR